MEAAIQHRQSDLTLVLENVWDPHNLGAILRSADAVGVLAVHLLYYIEKEPNLRQVAKQSSASAKKWLDIHSHDSVQDCVASLRESGFQIYASHLTKSSISLYDLDLTKPTAFVVGNEHRGVSDDLCTLADGVFFIPMMGMVESLNVSVATAVTLYEAYRQRCATAMYETSKMNEEEIAELLRDWAKR